MSHPQFQSSPSGIMPGQAFHFSDPQFMPAFQPSPSSMYPQYHDFSGHPSPSHTGSIAPQRTYSESDQHRSSASILQHPNQMQQHPHGAASETVRMIPPVPAIINNSSGLPINLSQGAVQTESRGIFIGNLPYSTNWRDLRGHLSSAGRIIRCDVPRKPNNKGRGYATVLFTSAEDAARACEMFNGTIFQGRPMRVRLDTYANTKTAKTPTVGSGSAGSGGSMSGGNQSSFFTDGDTETGQIKQEPEEGGRKSSASV